MTQQSHVLTLAGRDPVGAMMSGLSVAHVGAQTSLSPFVAVDRVHTAPMRLSSHSHIQGTASSYTGTATNCVICTATRISHFWQLSDIC